MRPLAGHQFTMPAQNGVWRHKGRDLCEQPPTKPVSQFSKAAALAVVETQALASQSGLQPSILFAEARQFLALRRRQAGPSMRAIGVRTPDPDAEIGLGEIEIAGHARNALALVEHQTHGLGLEVVIKLPARAPGLLGSVGHRSGHRIHLSEDVHETGSSPHAHAEVVSAFLENGMSEMMKNHPVPR